ncbi:hypothetical protein JR316_0005353 [Psilocybe cubensis]|uniref:Uncharacterized protein n=2 Tax=Psilocybe cubensis TaxID=181762 RepID=A0ACB8H5Y4_PSICU|nr:hypothetical protein JR316_0005353 [Psilocybe cubensis]KAH9483249.1 hypothetical protein JR316_0005353 [Psilocybe cubensis]
MQSGTEKSTQRPAVIISNCGNITTTVTNNYTDTNYDFAGFGSNGFNAHNAHFAFGPANAAHSSRMPGTGRRTYSHKKTSTSTSHSQTHQTRTSTASRPGRAQAQQVPVPNFAASGDRLGADIQNYVHDVLSLHGLGHHLHPWGMGSTGLNGDSDSHPNEHPEAEDHTAGRRTTTETCEISEDGTRTKTRTVHVTQDFGSPGECDTGIRVHIGTDPGLCNIGSSTGAHSMASDIPGPPPAYSASPPKTEIVANNLNSASTPTQATSTKQSNDGVDVVKRDPRKSWIKRLGGKLKRSLSWFF